MTTGTTAIEAAQTAFSCGLLASGISVGGLTASHNQAVAAKMFRTATEADPFDAEMHAHVGGLVHFRGQRWPDVLRFFPAESCWRRAAYGCAAAMAATALASLGVFEEAFRRA